MTCYFFYGHEILWFLKKKKHTKSLFFSVCACINGCFCPHVHKLCEGCKFTTSTVQLVLFFDWGFQTMIPGLQVQSSTYLLSWQVSHFSQIILVLLWTKLFCLFKHVLRSVAGFTTSTQAMWIHPLLIISLMLSPFSNTSIYQVPRTVPLTANNKQPTLGRKIYFYYLVNYWDSMCVSNKKYHNKTYKNISYPHLDSTVT